MKKIPAFANSACLYTHFHVYAQNTTSFKGLARFLYLLIKYRIDRLVTVTIIHKNNLPVIVYAGGVHPPDPLCKIRDA